jgi:hypothetical protein
MKLLTEELFKVIEEAVASAKRSILIVSPYIKKETAYRIVNIVKNKSLELKLLTLPPGKEYITGATDLRPFSLSRQLVLRLKCFHPYTQKSISLTKKH